MYVVSKNRKATEEGTIYEYGIAMDDNADIKFDNVTVDFNAISDFVERLNAQKAELCHLPYLIEEFISKGND